MTLDGYDTKTVMDAAIALHQAQEVYNLELFYFSRGASINTQTNTYPNLLALCSPVFCPSHATRYYNSLLCAPIPILVLLPDTSALVLSLGRWAEVDHIFRQCD